jgi:hypothetical protein
MGEAPKIQNIFLVMGQSRKVMAKKFKNSELGRHSPTN